jgi:lysophospholipase L1-like esterase
MGDMKNASNASRRQKLGLAILAAVLGLQSSAALAQRDGADRPTLWLVGDSTVKNGTRGNGRGWGEQIGELFDPDQVRVENRALGGRSSRTFQTEGLWDAVLADAKSGDFVLIQMGHNDGGPVNDNFRARGSLPGVGEETEEIDNLLTGKHEVVHTYGWYLRKYVRDAKAARMTPILVSPVPRRPKRPVDAERIELDRFGRATRQVAEEEGVAFLNLFEIVMRRYAEHSPEELKTLYFGPEDDTHTSVAGARLNAECVVEGLRGLDECPMVDFLIAQPVP